MSDADWQWPPAAWIATKVLTNPDEGDANHTMTLEPFPGRVDSVLQSFERLILETPVDVKFARERKTDSNCVIVLPLQFLSLSKSDREARGVPTAHYEPPGSGLGRRA